MDEKTGAQLDDHEVRTYLEFAGERAYISKDEMVRHHYARRWLLAHALWRGRGAEGGKGLTSREGQGGGTLTYGMQGIADALTVGSPCILLRSIFVGVGSRR